LSVQPSRAFNLLLRDTADSNARIVVVANSTHTIFIIQPLFTIETASSPNNKILRIHFMLGQILNIHRSESSKSDMQGDVRHVDTFNLQSFQELAGKM
jgi:hypothetical protein